MRLPGQIGGSGDCGQDVYMLHTLPSSGRRSAGVGLTAAGPPRDPTTAGVVAAATTLP